MIALLCPRAQWAGQLAGELDGAVSENWAPFRAWRATARVNAELPTTTRGGSGASRSDSGGNGGNGKEAEVFILVCGEGQRAAIAGALQLLTVCPGAPIIQFDACWSCDAMDPALKAGQLIVCESARALKKEELYLLHASPTPIADLAAAVPDAQLFVSATETFARPGVPFGSCDTAIDFPSQREWLRRRYEFQAFDTISYAVGSTIQSNGGAWIALGVVAGLAGDPVSRGRRLPRPERETLRQVAAYLRAIGYGAQTRE